MVLKQGLVLQPLPRETSAHTDSFKRTLQIRQAFGLDYPTAVPTSAARRQRKLTAARTYFHSLSWAAGPSGTESSANQFDS